MSGAPAHCTTLLAHEMSFIMTPSPSLCYSRTDACLAMHMAHYIAMHMLPHDHALDADSEHGVGLGLGFGLVSGSNLNKPKTRFY